MLRLVHISFGIRAFIGLSALLAVLPAAAQTAGGEWTKPHNLLELNTAYNDFAPAWDPEGLLFYNSDSSGYSLFYTAEYLGDKRFTARGVVRGELNRQPRNNQAFISFAPTGEIYYSTFRMTQERPWQNIFEIARQGDFWGKPGLAPAVNGDFFCSHPAFSPSGKTLVFVSDRPQGRGGTDLWMVGRRTNGGWGEVITLGDVLNSGGNEITPCFAGEDTLYFASDGFGGKGGFEIYRSVRIGGVWQAPVPMAELNSAADDSDLCFLPDGSAVFASNRPGGKGGLDLYTSRALNGGGDAEPAVQYSIALSPERITVEELSLTENFTLLPYIFFPRSSGELPESLHLLRSSEADEFTIENITPDVHAVYADLLNIIGLRLRGNPAARLQITGCTESAEAPELGRRRAEAVRDYLHAVWGIAPERLAVAARGLPASASNSAIPEGREENRRVELSTESSAILAALKLSHVRTLVQSPPVQVILDARPRRLVRNWRLEVRSPAATLIRQAEGTSLPDTLLLRLSDSAAIAMGSSEISIELRAVDSRARHGAASRFVPVDVLSTVYKREQNIADRKQDWYVLPHFAYDQAALSNEQRLVLSSIAAVIAPDARVEVVGYTDLLGSDERNRQLALERAANIADALQALAPATAISIKAAAKSDLFDNSTPIGRFYSRTVRILIETPLSQN